MKPCARCGRPTRLRKGQYSIAIKRRGLKIALCEDCLDSIIVWVRDCAAFRAGIKAPWTQKPREQAHAIDRWGKP